VVELCANYLKVRLFGKETDLTELRGAIELARKIIQLPIAIKEDDITKKIVSESLKSFEMKFIREGLDN
jgi:hypothetical protein